MVNAKEFIAKNIAQALQPDEVVNLGIGIPTMVVEYLPASKGIVIQVENGIIGCEKADENNMDPYLRDAGGAPVGIMQGGSTVDSAVSFGMIRGGHVDTTILGAFQVSQEGDIASWDIPGKIMKGAGGAMDLVVGAKKVIVAMTHLDKNGNSKLVPCCTLPLTAIGQANMIYTDMAIIEVKNHRMKLIAIAPDTTVEKVQECTGVELVIPDHVGQMLAV